MPLLRDTPFVRQKPDQKNRELLHNVGDMSRMHAIILVGGGIVCAFLIVLSMVFWRVSSAAIDRLSEDRFVQEVENIADKIQEQIDEQVAILYSMRSLLLAGEEIGQSEWNKMVREAQIKQRYPTLLAVAYLENSRHEDRETATDTEEEQGNFVIRYIEPYESNQDYVGLSIEGDDWELDRIRDAGELTSVGRVRFGEIADDYVYLLPVFESGLPQLQFQERRDAHLGFLIAVIQPGGLLESLSYLDEDAHHQFSLEMSDIEGDVLLKREIPRGFMSVENVSGRLVWSTPVRSTGLEWTLRVSGPKYFGVGAMEMKMPLLILLGGCGFSLLLFTIVYLAASSRMRALQLAKHMTAELGKFQLAVSHASNHIIITNTDGEILFANIAAEEITGYSRGEMIGKTPRIWGKQMLPEFYKEMWKVIKEEKRPFNGEIINQRKDGTKYDALVHISPIVDKHGLLYGFVGIEEDITARKRLEKSRSEFVSLVSHQLRTPLTAMRLTIETLMNGVVGPVDKVQREMLLRAMEYAVHMSETIFTMLTISHLEAGKISVALGEVNLCGHIEVLSREYEPEYGRKQQKVSVQCPKELSLQTDGKLLKEILANLISNAIKYTPAGGTVTIRAQEENNQVRIDVADSGMGIPLDEQKRTFQKFFRAKNILKKDTSGTGLGLYLVHSLTKLLGGRITFVSTENKGTTFSLFLPITTPSHEKDFNR